MLRWVEHLPKFALGGYRHKKRRRPRCYPAALYGAYLNSDSLIYRASAAASSSMRDPAIML